MMKPSYSELRDEEEEEETQTSVSTKSERVVSPVSKAAPSMSTLPSNALPAPNPASSNSNAIGGNSNNIDGNLVNSTLDEPITETLKRDLMAIWAKLRLVMVPAKSGSGDENNVLRDWDLWGPLVLCLVLSLLLGAGAPASQSVNVFTFVFVIVWVGSAVVSVNAKLLGGNISFFQSVCVLGYCLGPLLVAAIVALFVNIFVVKAVISIVAFFWAATASINFLGRVNLENRKLLATYPIFLFYFVISWAILISQSIW